MRPGRSGKINGERELVKGKNRFMLHRSRGFLKMELVHLFIDGSRGRREARRENDVLT